MSDEPSTQRIDVEIVKHGVGWHIARAEICRRPLLGAITHPAPVDQRRFVERGAVVAGHDCVRVYGPGHHYEIQANSRSLYIPIDVLEWVVVTSEQAVEPPDVEHAPPRGEPIDIPFPESVPLGLYPDWAAPFLAFPADVGTWASCLDVRATSLTQRVKRVTGVGAKELLSAIRATVAFELAADYRGHGAQLAADAGYASQAHLSSDMTARFGTPLSELLRPQHRPELDWLRLLRSSIR